VVITPPKLTRDQYEIFLDSPLGVERCVLFLEGKVTEEQWKELLDGKEVLSSGENEQLDLPLAFTDGSFFRFLARSGSRSALLCFRGDYS